MELKQITERVYYIPNPANIGVIKNSDNSVVLIDTGLDDDTGKKILRLFDENDLSLKAIINTHSHADHCGGNSYLKDKTSAIIYAPEVENAIIRYPSLEPLYLFSGAHPIKDLENKFLMAKPSRVDYVIRTGQKRLKLGDLELKIIPLPGHSSNQIGVEIDDVLFCADAIFSSDTLTKHKIPFYTDIDLTKKTLDWLSNSTYEHYVPSHAKPSTNIRELVQLNLSAIEGIEQIVVRLAQERKTTEQILSEVCKEYNINIGRVQQHFLMNTVIMAYLSSLKNNGKVGVELDDGFLYWKTNKKP